MAIRLTDWCSGGTLAATDGDITAATRGINNDHQRQSSDPGTYLGHRPPLAGHHPAVHREGRQATPRFAADRAHAGASRRRAPLEVAAFGTLCRGPWRVDRQPGGATGGRRPAGDLPRSEER